MSTEMYRMLYTFLMINQGKTRQEICNKLFIQDGLIEIYYLQGFEFHNN